MKTSANRYHAMDCRCSKCPGADPRRQGAPRPQSLRNPFRLTLGLALLGAVIGGTLLMTATVAS